MKCDYQFDVTLATSADHYLRLRRCFGFSYKPSFLTSHDQYPCAGPAIILVIQYSRSCAMSSISRYFFMSPFMLSLHLFFSQPLLRLQETSRAKTINVFRACLGAQLTICAQKWRNFLLFSTVSLRFVFWVEFVFFFVVLAPSVTDFAQMWLCSRLELWPNHFCFPGKFQQVLWAVLRPFISFGLRHPGGGVNF